MPIPTPNKGESQKDFVSRCMGNPTMRKEFPDQKQRAAVCNSKFREKRSNEMVFLEGEVGVTRVERFNERDHLVVPVIGIMEGVFHASNSDFPEFAPAQEIEKSTPGWNGRPVVLDHPEVKGVKVSANSPSILESQAFGSIFNSRFEDKKLKFEAWVDKEKAAQIGGETAGTVEALEKGEVREVSIGAFLDVRDAFGKHDGKDFFGVWENIVPDHLAIMSAGKKGACSVEAGCGTNRMAQECECNKGVGERFATFVDRFRNFIGLGESMRSRMRAIQAVLDSQGSFEFVFDISDDGKEAIIETRNGLVRRAFEISDDGSVKLAEESVPVRPKTEFVDLKTAEGNDSMTEKEKRVNSLIENSRTRFAEDHREFLMGLEDEQLALLEPPEEKKDPPKETKTADDGKTKADGDKKETKAASSKTDVTLDQYIEKAPPEVRTVIQAGLRAHESRVAELVGVIKTNSRNKFSDDQLKKMDIEMLESLAALASDDDYSGQGGPRTLSKSEAESYYAPPPPSCFEDPNNKTAA